MLYLCATPIGNLEDISLRALRILKEVDLIACEDTRVSAKLLLHYDIHTPTTSYHEHNRKAKGEKLLSLLREGKHIAMISDAGMPGISDPGEDMVASCIEEGINVTVIPGSSAGIMALVLSGLSGRRFVFEGFLPRQSKERKEVLSSLSQEERTIIMYESPHHLKRTLDDLFAICGGMRQIAIARELTKKYEEIWHTTIEEAVSHYQSQNPKGEYVLVLEGLCEEKRKEKLAAAFASLSPKEHLTMYLEQGIDRKEALKKVAKERGVSKRDIYNIVMKKEGVTEDEG